MKTTMMFRNIANPRRTTLAHLKDADELQTPEQPEHAVDLPTADRQPPPHHPHGVPVAAARAAHRAPRAHRRPAARSRSRPPHANADQAPAGASAAGDARQR